MIFVHKRLGPMGQSLAFAALGVAVLASSAWAVSPLPPGKTLINPASTLAAGSSVFELGGVPATYPSLVASSTFPYNYNGTTNGAFSGFVSSKVFADAAGELAFSYTFNNLNVPAGSPSDILRATINGGTNPWTGFNIFDAGADGLGSSSATSGPFGNWSNGDPFDIQRNLINSGIGIDFSVLSSGTELLSQSSDHSATIWLTTDAKQFAPTTVGLSDNGLVGTAQGFAPATVPEPSTLILSMAGVAGALIQLRRRSQRR
jgi:hypothetical protein